MNEMLSPEDEMAPQQLQELSDDPLIQPLRILLVLADDSLAGELEKVLGAGPMRIDRAHSVSEALSTLSKGGFDIVLADLLLEGGLRDESGTLRGGGAAELAARFPTAPCVVFCKEERPELLQWVMGAGAVDYWSLDKQDLEGLPSTLQRIWNIRRKLVIELGIVATRYENLVQALPDIIYELDPDGHFTFVNQSVSILGYKPEELIGRHFSMLLYTEDVPHVSRDHVLPRFLSNRTGARNAPKLFDERRGRDRKTENLEIRLKRRDGSGKDDLIGSVISYGEIASVGTYRYLGALNEKVFVGTVGIIRDITLRRKSEDMLRRMYQAVDQTPVAVGILDTDLTVEYVNAAFFSLTATGPDQVLGRRFTDFIVESSAVDAYADLLESLRSGIDWKGELQVTRVGLDPFWSSVTISAISSPSGSVTSHLCVLEDATQKRALEDILRRAKDEAEAASRAKSEFLASMGANLMTPLESIISTCQVLLADDPRDDQAERLSAAKKFAGEVLDTLRDVLDLSRFQAKELALELEELQLGPLAEQIVEPYRSEAESKDLALSLVVDDAGVGTIRADRDRITRIVSNLLSNAIKFTAKGSVDVKFSVLSSDGSPSLSVSVRDTGIGISRIDQRNLFKPFTKINAELGKSSEGTGLGLAIAKELAVSMGGDIWVESALGSGSVFSFFVAIGSSEELVAQGSDAEGKAPPQARSPYRILVVEDNSISQDYLDFFLSGAGHEVRIVSDGYTVMEILDHGDFDALIIDVQMLGQDGIGMAKTVRSYPGTSYDPRLPIIALASYETDEIENALRLGLFDTICRKPLDATALLVTLDELVRGRLGFDGERLMRTYAGAFDEFRHLLMSVDQDLPKRIESFDERISARDLDGAKATLHGIVSVLSPIGALRALQLVKRFRKAVTKEDESAALTAADYLLSECALIRKQLRKNLSEY